MTVMVQAESALRAIPILKSAGINVRVIHMDPYKDPDEFLKNLGTEAFQERIDAAESSFMFEISVLEKIINNQILKEELPL